MGSTVSIYNATNVTLDMALSQVGPLYYENMVLPGERFRRDVGKKVQNTIIKHKYFACSHDHGKNDFIITAGKVWFTIEAKCYTGEDKAYSDWSVAKPIIDWSLVGLGGAGAVIGVIPAVASGVGAIVGAGVRTGLMTGISNAGTILTVGATAGKCAMNFTPEAAAAVLKKLHISSAGWYFGSDRTLYVCGGPRASQVKIHSRKLQTLTIGDLDDVPALYITETRPAGFRAVN